jgi:hypothetical protein
MSAKRLDTCLKYFGLFSEKKDAWAVLKKKILWAGPPGVQRTLYWDDDDFKTERVTDIA